MSFLTVLKSDFKVFLKCINFQINNKAKMKNSQTCLRTVCRAYSHEIERRLPKPISEKIVTSLKKFDKIGPHYELIYRAPRSFTFVLAHASVLILIFAFPPLSFILAKKHGFKFPIRINDKLVINDTSVLSVIVGITAALLTFMYLLVSRFPLRVYKLKNSNNYVASYPHIILPWKMKNTTFKRGEVSRIDITDKMFYMTNYKIKGCKSIIFEDNFIRPVELDYMLKSDQESGST